MGTSNNIFLFNRGEQVIYNGQKATVKNVNYASKTITIIMNGKEYTVDSNDIFGINKENPYEECENYCKKRIVEAQNEYDERSEKSSIAIKQYYTFNENAYNARKDMNSMLRETNSFEELSNRQKTEFLKLQTKYTLNLDLANKQKTIFDINNSMALDCTSVARNWNYQLALVQTMENNSIFG